MPTVHRPFFPLCLYCKKNKVKWWNRKFCSTKCYNESGYRSKYGKINGGIWAQNYWRRFDEVFHRKYGFLPRVERTRMLVTIGKKKAYKDEYYKKKELIKELDHKESLKPRPVSKEFVRVN